jgi:DNA gyrase/topoisomerase IV subunit B
MSNEEIKNLVDIIGLKFNQKYDKENIKSLRYGHVMIMADQDSDGSHIVGLLINFIHRESLNHFFLLSIIEPSCLKTVFAVFRFLAKSSAC